LVRYVIVSYILYLPWNLPRRRPVPLSARSLSYEDSYAGASNVAHWLCSDFFAGLLTPIVLGLEKENIVGRSRTRVTRITGSLREMRTRRRGRFKATVTRPAYYLCPIVTITNVSYRFRTKFKINKPNLDRNRRDFRDIFRNF